MTTNTENANHKNPTGKQSARHTARLAAVQALYQLEQTNENFERVIADMVADQFKTLTNDDAYPKPDIEFFKSLVSNSQNTQEKADSIIVQFLSSGWRIERLSTVTRAILRLAAHELIYEILTPHAVILDEYIEITKDFCEFNEVAFVNGILDNMAKTLRPTP
jgi:transcription antitermination protein NusB